MTNDRRFRTTDGEIDLIELAQALWAEKIIILAFIVAATSAALGYYLSVAPQFASQATIASAPLNAFGSLAGALEARQSDRSSSGIAAGTQVANDTFSVFVMNLNSPSEQRVFKDSLASAAPFALTVSKGRTTSDPIAISATAGAADIAKDAVENYLIYTSRVTAAQINDYLSGLGITQRVEPGSLYRLEQPAAVNSAPVKPRRNLIISLGFVLGGMLGVFVALIRIMYKKRISKG
ncbi:Wzz/FepE/Etk N-terminal domain-containing protein [Pseudomonas sp. DNDY-54]|uniref:Wzz/FepE/Etk N-terminal domain-containing protein n=1 Tax=Pseudomonas sp. DNDY-54 TaxID=2870860 RepID=UPI001CA3F605|nr:Wzz/FepE/Etk N-terminal domain-containing protein [Pseudomonas sp. DNDY-54]